MHSADSLSQRPLGTSRMWYKLYINLLFITTVASKSMTILLDTTTSMDEEIDVIKTNLGSVFHLLDNSSDIENFILIPYNDPDVGPPYYSQTPDGLMTSLRALRVSGWSDCPENSVAGIEMALQVSRPGSFVFVFTDAYANDNSRFTAVENLCRSTRSQIIIFLSGKCVTSGSGSSYVGNIDVYYDIAKACSGSVFQLEEPNSLRQAFKFMKEFIKGNWNNIVRQESFTNYKELQFSVDSFTTDLVIAVNGYDPLVQIIYNNDGSPTTKTIVDTRQSLVIRVVNPDPGEYRAIIRSQGSTSATFYRRKELPFHYGFSTKLPKSLKETCLRPLPGHSSYILIAMAQPSTTKLKSLKLQMGGENDRKELTIAEIDVNKGLYAANSFFEPDKSFRIVVSGQITSTYQDFVVSTEILNPQQIARSQRIKPSVELLELESTTIDFGTSLTIACKVIGYPKPHISLEDETGASLPSEVYFNLQDVLLEIPSVYITYATIENVDKNTTIYCKGQNSEGENSQTVELFVYRPYSFEVIQSPEDTSVEYGEQGKLYCEVKAYPETNTKWYFNDTLLESSENIEISLEDNTLLIRNMTLNDAGEYNCEVANEVEMKTFTAMVTISGLEAPEIEVRDSEIVLKPGDWTDIECRIIRGKPKPKITWKYKSDNGYEFTYLPEGVIHEDSKLKIPVVETAHNGVYRCEAVNVQGLHNRDISIKVQYAPIISSNQEESPDTLRVREGETVELKCEVDAVPAARVRWEMSQDDVIMALDDRHITDDHFTHRFDALWRDSGNYHCYAENDVGRAEKTITVNVLVTPYIETPAEETVTVKEGSNVRFTCNVSYGNPVPTTKWEFAAPDSIPTVLLRGNSTSILQLTRVTRQHEGSYSCLAENEVGYDTIKIQLVVQL